MPLFTESVRAGVESEDGSFESDIEVAPSSAKPPGTIKNGFFADAKL
jgi:hypothetical protein